MVTVRLRLISDGLPDSLLQPIHHSGLSAHRTSKQVKNPAPGKVREFRNNLAL